MSTTFSRPGLAALMYRLLGNVATFLAYPAPGSQDEGAFEEEVNQILLHSGADSAEALHDERATRALAALAAWRKACNDLAAHYTFALAGERYERTGAFRQAAACLARAEADALPYLGTYRASRQLLGPWCPPSLG